MAVYNAAGKYPELREVCRQATARYPGEPVVHLRLGQALAGPKEKKDTNKAVEQFNEAIDQATKRQRSTRDERRLAQLREVIAEATAARDKLTSR